MDTPCSLRSPGYVPLADIPVLEFSAFSAWLEEEIQAHARIVSVAALPLGAAVESSSLESSSASSQAQNPGQNSDMNKAFRIYVLLAHDAQGLLDIAAFDAASSYPSLTNKFPAMHLFERELYEQHGIMPEGHPWLKPVRFSHHSAEKMGNTDFYKVTGDEVHEVAVGPIHAGVIECGHFRFQCQGELVMHLEISLGYHHRGIEAMLKGGPNLRTLPLLEVAAGDSSIAHSWAYCSLLEAVAVALPDPSAPIGPTNPSNPGKVQDCSNEKAEAAEHSPTKKRGQLIRAIALELERLANHTGDLGALAGDVGFLPTQAYCGRLRGDWLNMSALLCGNRFGRGLLTPGGVNFDIEASRAKELGERLKSTLRDVRGALKLYKDSSLSQARLHGIGVLSTQAASDLGMVGPAARASGLLRDCRAQHPQPGLEDIPFSINPLPKGDIAARVNMRMQEVDDSAALIELYLKRLGELPELSALAEGVANGGAQYLPKFPAELPTLPPNILAVSLVEGWRGEVCHLGITGSDGKFLTYKVTDPSFHNWMGLALVLRDEQISDFPLCNKSFNLSYCGHDL